MLHSVGSEQRLQGRTISNLRLIMEFIDGVYYPCWFSIKWIKQWIEGPRHVLLYLQLLKQQKKIVHDTVMPTDKRSAFYAYGQMIIQSLLHSWPSEKMNSKVYGNEKHQALNPWQTTLWIYWLVRSSRALSDIYIPPRTLKIKGFLNEPMSVPQWPCFTKSIERIVKQVTEMSGTACSHKKRECVRRAPEVSQIIMQSNEL